MTPATSPAPAPKIRKVHKIRAEGNEIVTFYNGGEIKVRPVTAARATIIRNAETYYTRNPNTGARIHWIIRQAVSS